MFVVLMILSPLFAFVAIASLMNLMPFVERVFSSGSESERAIKFIFGLLAVLMFYFFPGFFGLFIRSKLLRNDSDLVGKLAAFLLPLIWYFLFCMSIDRIARTFPSLSRLAMQLTRVF